MCISNPLDYVWVAMVLEVGGDVVLREDFVIGARELC
jgi:hypothetical protein